MENIKTAALDVVGSSGIRNYGGYIFEEYISQLNGTNRAYIFDMMRRQDPAVGQLINIMNNVLKSLTYEIKIKSEYEEVSEAEKQKEFISKLLFDNMHRSFDDVISEIITNNIYGYSLFEGLWKNEQTESFGAITTLKDLLWRSPRTIWEFRMDENEMLDHVLQRAYGDGQKEDAKLPAKNVFIFTLEKEGKNFEGISPLRRVYGAWKMKQTLLNLLIIGSDKFAIPTLIFKSALAQQEGPIQDKMQQAIKKYQGGKDAFLIVPHNYESVDSTFGFDPEKIISSIEHCNSEIIKESSATFLEMQKGGSYALGSAMIKFFHIAMDSKAKVMAGPFNNRIIPSLIAFNRPNEPVMVELMFSAAGQSVSKEYAESLALLAEKNILSPDDTLEDFIRKNMNLPAQDQETIRVNPANAQEEGEPQDNNVGEEDEDEDNDFSSYATHKKAPYLIKRAKFNLKNLIGMIIRIESSSVIDKLRKSFNSAKTDADKLKLPDISTNKERMRKQINSSLSMDYEDALAHVKDEISSMNRRKAKKDNNSYGKIGKTYTKEEAKIMANMLGEEIEDTLGGTYVSLSVDAEDFSQLETRLLQSAEKIKKKSRITSLTGIVASKTINTARRDYFQSIENKIESYTYYNDEPVTDLCSYLNGKTFKVGSEKVPPFHWGCDGYLVPNMKTWKNNPEPDKIKITAKLKEGMDFLT